MSDDKFNRTSNVLHYKSSLDRIATLSGPDQAQRACDESVSDALGLSEDDLPSEVLVRRDRAAWSDPMENWPVTKPYRAPESDGA